MIDEKALQAWRKWVGRTRTRREVLDPEALRRFAAAVEADLDVERHPPPLGHWAFFLDAAPTASLALDGLPAEDDSLPPVDLPRRMFAAGALRFLRPLEIGKAAEMSTAVRDVRARTGASGDLVFIELGKVLSQAGAVCLEETQTIVCIGQGAPPPTVKGAVGPEPGEAVWTPQPVDLFRFSAATFNSHRIHYDHPYATGVEGYPDLVVHGPFTAARLCGYAQSRLGAPLRSFAFRAVAPLFAGQPVRLAPGEGAGRFAAVRCDGAVAMTAEAQV